MALERRKVPGQAWSTVEAQSGDGDTLSVTVDLSAAEILALESTPLVVVAAPGPGLMIVPVSVVSLYTFVTTPYEGNLQLGTPTGSFNQGVTNLSSTEDLIRFFALEWSGDPADADDADLLLEPEGDPLGAGDGTLTFVLEYQIHPTTI